MKSSVMFSFLAAIVLAFGAQTTWTQDAAVAEAPSPTSKEDFIKTADVLLALIGDPAQVAQRTDDLPKSDNPVVHQYILEAQNMTRWLGTAEMPVTQFEEFDALCGKGQRVLGSYGLAGVGTRIAKDTPPAEAAMTIQLLVFENQSKYLDVFLPSTLFSFHCSAAFMPALDRLYSALPKEQITAIRINGIHQARLGTVQMIAGALMLTTCPGIAAQDHGSILDQLETDWDNMVLILSPDDRSHLADMANKLSESFPEDIRKRVQALVERIPQAKYDAICSLSP